jgi:hypothetical protein
VLIAAKLPVATTTVTVLTRTSRRFPSQTTKKASPSPSAIKGASGPITTPRPMLASAASAIPGTSAGRAWVTCDPRHHRIRRTARRHTALPYTHLGADDQAGPKYTRPTCRQLHARRTVDTGSPHQHSTALAPSGW